MEIQVPVKAAGLRRVRDSVALQLDLMNHTSYT